MQKAVDDLIIHTQSSNNSENDETGEEITSQPLTINLLEEHYKLTIREKMDRFQKREILLEAIKKYNSLASFSFLIGKTAWEYRDLSKEFLADRQVVIEGLKKSVYTYSEVSDELKRDREVILASVEGDIIDGFSLVPDDLRGDREFVCKVLEKSAFSLKYASEELRNDEEVVLNAIKTSGLALQFASNRLKRDRDLAIKAIKGRAEVMEYIDSDIINSLLNDRNCLEDILSENPYALRDFIFQARRVNVPGMENDRDLFRIAFQKTKEEKFYHIMGRELREDKTFILELLDITKEIYRYLSVELKNDQEIKDKAEV
ncbi:predicted protein [Naegleria gruberi]|uniref:Predicted protein n=1 Tax=Naegleria gruberi TaxID=5762 RepID=D2VCT2_NAEGR|nr:uncharacterized protein NAEGRDRAFT_48503 [Naegleria gruberi]EFC45474.1 predicted protein [Naegleria gruberi]|eukprot:XP_002678218.1 predicted protein [Naegleria gruberi strain NEG-M]